MYMRLDIYLPSSINTATALEYVTVTHPTYTIYSTHHTTEAQIHY